MHAVRLMVSLFGALALVVLLWTDTNAQADQTDPALRNPAFAEFARQHPADWEHVLDPRVKPLVTWQRVVGGHAVVIGWADEQPNPGYTQPRVVIDVIHWDGSDLFVLGLPRTYNTKPVVIQDLKEMPQAGGLPRFPIPTYAPGHTGSTNGQNAANMVLSESEHAASTQSLLPVQLPQTGGGFVRSLDEDTVTNACGTNGLMRMMRGITATLTGVRFAGTSTSRQTSRRRAGITATLTGVRFAGTMAVPGAVPRTQTEG